MTSMLSPPTFKEVCRIVKNSSPEIYNSIFKHRLHEVYDFGDIDLKTINSGYENSKVFLQAAVLNTPSLYGFFRLSINGTDDRSIRLPCAFLYACDTDETDNTNHYVTALIRNPNGDLVNTGEYVFDLNTNKVEVIREVENALTSINYQAFIGCIGLLLTKGLRKTTTAPNPKLNAARVKAGKTPLPYVTKIDLTSYRNAGDHKGGTHASPCAHLRRAHIRRIAKDGKLIPVAAALVNWDGSPLMRTEYQVRS